MVMADKYSPVEIVIDANTRSRRVGVGESLELPDETQQIDLYYGSQYLFMAQVYKNVPKTVYDFATATEFVWGADSVVKPTTSNPIVTLNSSFNLAGDWAFDPVKGKICWRADLFTTELNTILNSTSEASLKFKSYLWALPSGSGQVLIAVFDFTVYKSAVMPTSAATLAVPSINDAMEAYYVPIWGDGAYERRKDGRTQVLFADGKWRALIPTLVDGAPVISWGDPED
jgi:hypothetical protein